MCPKMYSIQVISTKTFTLSMSAGSDEEKARAHLVEAHMEDSSLLYT
jgi:hypothetical protein